MTTKFDNEQWSSKFLPEIMTLTLSAHNIGWYRIYSKGKVIYIRYKQQKPYNWSFGESNPCFTEDTMHLHKKKHQHVNVVLEIMALFGLIIIRKLSTLCTQHAGLLVMCELVMQRVLPCMSKSFPSLGQILGDSCPAYLLHITLCPINELTIVCRWLWKIRDPCHMQNIGCWMVTCK